LDSKVQTTILELKAGDKAKVLGFKPGCPAYQQRLLALGLVPDIEFSVTRVAPFGDPIEIRVHNASLCLRKQEGSILQLERLGFLK
jgi:ferrous iron transport protein A